MNVDPAALQAEEPQCLGRGPNLNCKGRAMATQVLLVLFSVMCTKNCSYLIRWYMHVRVNFHALLYSLFSTVPYDAVRYPKQSW